MIATDGRRAAAVARARPRDAHSRTRAAPDLAVEQAAGRSAAQQAATAELVDRARAGDAEALGTLVEKHHSQVYAYLVRLSGDREEAKDLAQEVFLRCCTKLNGLRDPRSFIPWMYRAAYRLYLDERKRRRGRNGRLDPEATAAGDGPPALGAGRSASCAGGRGGSPQVGDGIERELLRREQAERVRAGLLRLSPRHRSALLLRHYHQLSIKEIAAATGARPGTVKSRLHYAAAKLRQILEEEA